MVTMLGLLVAALVLVTSPSPAAAADPILVPAVSTAWPGKIFVSQDEWALSDSGFRAAPDAARFAQNLARWFAGNRPGHFLVYSSSFGLTGQEPGQDDEECRPRLGDGRSRRSPSTLQTLQHYDAVFLAEKSADISVLIDYVRSGGNVYLAGGTGAQ